jgi:hypothetical protein
MGLLSQTAAAGCISMRASQFQLTERTRRMNVNRIVRIVAGLFVLVSLALGAPGSPLYVSSNWLWFTAFVGVNLFQSGITRFCPLDIFLKKAGVRQA